MAEDPQWLPRDLHFVSVPHFFPTASYDHTLKVFHLDSSLNFSQKTTLKNPEIISFWDKLAGVFSFSSHPPITNLEWIFPYYLFGYFILVPEWKNGDNCDFNFLKHSSTQRGFPKKVTNFYGKPTKTNSELDDFFPEKLELKPFLFELANPQ